MFRICVLLLAVVLAGCGFKLREELVLPPGLATLRVLTPDSFSPLQRNLEQALRRAGAKLSESEDGAVLRVSRAELVRQPLSVGDTGRVQEYLLSYAVEFELTDARKQAVLPRQTITLERDFTFDTFQAFGTPGEEEMVRAELERDMVQAILRRIDAVAR